VAHFLLAWELGANLGHATRLRSVALALKARGHRVSFVLRDVVGSAGLLGAELGPSFQAPLLLHNRQRQAWSQADILLSCGYDDAATLGPLARAWKALFDLVGCDALLADYAPTALLAARLAGLPALHVGHGFSVPPRLSPLPIFRDWSAAPAGHAEAADALALSNVNAVLAEGGVAPLPALADLFHPARTLLCAWPELDHYAGRGRDAADYLGPDCEFSPGVPADWPDAPGPRVFAYLRAGHADHAEVLRALDAQGCATLCFFPDRPASAPVSPRIRYSDQPVDLRQALPTCSLVVCHAGQATVAQALRLGIPCLLLPTQTEQFLLARQLERFGAAVNAGARARPVDYAGLLAGLLRADGASRQAAQALARSHAGSDPAGLTAQIVAAAESLSPVA
jgi:hypothetical protein